MLQGRRWTKDIDIEVIEGREMTEQEVESVAYLLFTWWRREFEENNSRNKAHVMFQH
jgi:hypothetical protein